MKEHIKRLERSHEFWVLLGIGFIFFLLRLPSLFEPHWYGDEGIYQTIGLALTRGRILYTQIWDNKPPLLYYTYALVGSNQFLIRLLSLLVGLAAITVFFFLTRKLFRERNASLIATSVFAILFGIPMFEGNIANAENFMLLPIIAAGLLVYKCTLQVPSKTTADRVRITKYLLISGLLLGIAFLYKIVAVFDFAAFFVFFIIATFPKELSFSITKSYLVSHWKKLLFFLIGFLVPFLLTIIYFAIQKGLGEYIHAIFLSTVGYVGYKNAFIIPQGLLITKVILLALFSLVLFVKRQQFKLSTLFILLWVGFSLFNSFFSQRPYTHYVLVLIPSLSLLIGNLYFKRATALVRFGVITLIVGFLALHYFDHWNMTKTLKYYGNFVKFTTGQESLISYDTFFDRRTIRDNEIIQYLTTHRKATDTLYVWGNDAQIYPLTDTIPPGRFTVAYHVTGSYVNEVGQILKQHPPTYIVVMTDVPQYPFPLYNYRQVLGIQNADIYERID